ncbi:hypothetical protein SANA_01530 [Gottschalkiaceae bacterium SANA]|nr:hypothetical protein SANA_01530 [Gottschalkiaceae bacterium SANA]
MKTYSNETMKLLYERSSIRVFEDRPIPPEVMEEVLLAGLHGATGGNLQPYAIIQIESEEKKKELMDTGEMQPLVGKAPTNLLFCVDWRRIGRWAHASNAPFIATKSFRHFWIAFQDTIIAAQNICTAADSVGLGSVYIGTVESCFMELKQIFKLPEGVFPIVLLSMGYPAQPIKIAPKLGTEIMVHKEVYKDLPIETLVQAQEEKYDHKTFPVSIQNLSSIKEVAFDLGGKEYEEKLEKSIMDAGSINMAQRYFGLHYKANWSANGNMDLIHALKAYGFPWITGENFPK